MASALAISVVIRGEDDLSKPVAAATRSLSGFNRAAQQTDKAAGTATSAVGKLASSFGKFAAVGAGLAVATAGLTAITRAASGLGKALIGSNVTMENTRAQLVAMTKDGKQADRILQQIREEADKTPFAFEEMAKATASLMPAAKQSGVALMDLVQQAEILAASNPAEGLEGAAFALREALSGDFTSVIDRFNLSRQRINELKNQGVPALQAISTAMKEMGLDADIVAKRAETLEGRWSTFLDTISGVARIVGEPLFEQLKIGLAGLQTFFDRNKETIQGWARTAGQAIADFVVGAASALGQVAAALKPVAERMTTFVGSMAAAETLATAVNKAFGDLIPFELNKTLDALDKGFADLTTEIVVLSAILRDAGIAEGIREIGRAAEATFPQTAQELKRVADASEYLDERFRRLVATVTQGNDQMGTSFTFLGTVVGTALTSMTANWTGFLRFLGYGFEQLDVYIRGYRIGLTAIGDTTEAVARRIIAAWQSVEAALGPIFRRLAAAASSIPTPFGGGAIPTPLGPVGGQVTPGAPPPREGPTGPVGAYQHGGSFTVGGAGGPDSQMVAFRATPGERVTVQTPAQAAAGAVHVVVNVGEVRDRADADHLASILPDALSRALEQARSQQGLPQVSGLFRYA